MRRRPILLRLAIASLVIGAFALVRNLLFTFSTLQAYPNAQFLPTFLSPTEGNGGTSAFRIFFVWGPVVFGLIGITLLVTHIMTSRARAAQQQQQPQQGWQQPQPWQPAHGPAGGAGQHAPQPSQPQSPVQPLGGQQPPPPNAAHRIQP